MHSGGEQVANLSFESGIRFKWDLGLLQELQSAGWWSSCLVAKPPAAEELDTTPLLPCHFDTSKKGETG